MPASSAPTTSRRRFHLPRQFGDLGAPYRSREVAEVHIQGCGLVRRPLRQEEWLAPVGRPPRSPVQLLVSREDDAPLPARVHVLVPHRGDSRDVAESPNVPVVELGPVRLRAVLDEGYSVPTGHLGDSPHVSRVSGDVGRLLSRSCAASPGPRSVRGRAIACRAQRPPRSGCSSAGVWASSRRGRSDSLR